VCKARPQKRKNIVASFCSTLHAECARLIEAADARAENYDMGWLALGILYSVAYVIGAKLLVDEPSVLSWFRACALFIPPLCGVVVIVRRRRRWRGCEWLFWATIGLGLMMSAI